ncbi:Diguanylate cyclase DosC [Tepidimonas sediminis]|uniref:Diguanylate cyclase DosC n=1 Tax=Tepidimonas sediminis TaxID=2588941 RepID=A0A554WK70_9BURK|nr:diguanylate cyclase [Tepidimonas sediminis]TSE23972.1 Diguanylate cyclase DosC [Tepidimonas sediminis]
MTTPSRRPADPVQEWAAILEATPPDVRQRVAELVQRHRAALAEAFYAEMLAHPQAHVFLDAQVVHQRLHASMQRWLGELFAPRQHDELAAIVAHQRHVGEVHARIQLPMHLVARGARFLKGRLLTTLLQEGADAKQAERALLYIGDLLDLALELMAESYVRDTQREARSEEAFRLHALTQNLQVERERQRFLLANWGQEVLFALHRGGEPLVLPTLRGSEFGLWFMHKGSNVFEGAPEVDLVLRGMERVDGTLLPQLAASTAGDPAHHQALLLQLQSELDNLQYLVQMLFERHVELESGRDALTRLLNRRFLAPILAREIHLAQQRRIPFALLMLDIDHFKQVNDRHGHDAGDVVLQQTAALLLNHVRSSDFVFRFGGEEFLVVLVDVPPAQAAAQADKLRRRIAAHRFDLPNGVTLQLTASIGVAAWNGHPDYQYLIQQADAALYAAKRGGRDRVCVADDGPVAQAAAPTIGA